MKQPPPDPTPRRGPLVLSRLVDEAMAGSRRGLAGLLLMVLTAWLSTQSSSAQPRPEALPPAPESTGPPARPESRLIDQTGALTVAERAALSRQLTEAAADGLSLYFIALNANEGLPDQNAATELARLWEDAPLTAVFLHVPGQSLSLGFAGTRLASLQHGELESLAQSALAAGRARQSLPEQGKTAVRRLLEDFTRYEAGESLTPLTSLLPGSATSPTAHQLLQWGGTATILLLAVLVLLARRRRACRPRLFPLTAPRERFSAPHSGGNNIMISFPNSRLDESVPRDR